MYFKKDVWIHFSKILEIKDIIKKDCKISIIIRPKSINLSWKELISSFDLLTKNLNDF